MKKITAGLAICAMATAAAFSQAASDETDPPPEYCRLQETYASIEQEASERFPDVSTDSKWLERKEWSMAQSDAATDGFSKFLGKPYKEWFFVAFENHWTASCEAASSGWQIVRAASLADAASSDFHRVRDAVTLEYFTRLEAGGPDPFFDPERYSAVNCTEAKVSGYNFIGCKLRSISYQTERDIYLVANVEGETLAVPYSSEAKGRVQGASVLASGADAVRLGYYVGELPLVEYKGLIQELD